MIAQNRAIFLPRAPPCISFPTAQNRSETSQDRFLAISRHCSWDVNSSMLAYWQWCFFFFCRACLLALLVLQRSDGSSGFWDLYHWGNLAWINPAKSRPGGWRHRQHLGNGVWAGELWQVWAHLNRETAGEKMCRQCHSYSCFPISHQEQPFCKHHWDVSLANQNRMNYFRGLQGNTCPTHTGKDHL